MRTVPAAATRVLDSRAFFARAWARGWALVSEQEILVVDKALTTVGRVEIGSKPEDVAITADGTVLVIADERALHAREVGHPGVRWSVDGNFIACHSTTGHVWAAEGRDHEIEITLREPATGTAVRRALVADPFRKSAVRFSAHPAPRRVVIWVVAGQDGQMAYLATDDGTEIRAIEVPPRDRIPPTFLQEGDTYLSAGDESLEHRRWPGGECIASLSWPTAGEDDPEDPAGYDVVDLPGQFASWSSTDGRIYIVDLLGMRFLGEMTIAGHPVRPVEELYPELRGDRAPCSDFGYSQLGPDGLVLTVHDYTQLAISRLSDWSPDPTRRH